MALVQVELPPEAFHGLAPRPSPAPGSPPPVAAVGAGTRSWRRQLLVDGYQGCTDYEIGDVPRMVVDTTDPTVGAEAIAARVVDFIRSLLDRAH